MEHALESLWLSRGGRGTVRDSRRGARAHVSVKEIYFPSDMEEGSLTFMILSRSSKKRWGLSGFVKQAGRHAPWSTRQPGGACTGMIYRRQLQASCAPLRPSGVQMVT